MRPRRSEPGSDPLVCLNVGSGPRDRQSAVLSLPKPCSMAGALSRRPDLMRGHTSVAKLVSDLRGHMLAGY